MSESVWSSFPLLVHIQSIDSTFIEVHTEASDARASAKPVQVTCLEGSNRFAFVGLSNGTTDVYFRASFLYLSSIKIPSVENKICNLLCSEDENYVAIGSVHGKLSILRCAHDRVRTDGSLIKAGTSNGDGTQASLFKLLYSVPNHVGNEITSMFWSFNERNLFIGDSCGLVSQLTVELLEQFPRPIPVKSVLEATSRVLQMDYMFPYLAIATVHSVYLCDIVSFEFVRVQLKKHRDIKATGLCFQLTVDRDNSQVQETTVGTLQLLIHEESSGSSGFIHVANLEGQIVRSVTVSLFPNTTMCSAKLFDPVTVTIAATEDSSSLELKSTTSTNETLDQTLLGNLLVFDTNYIVSYTHEFVYIIEQSQLQIVAWTHFNKIQKIKLVSNYVFIWHGKTLTLISLTPFRSYGQQLQATELIPVLEKWIDHAIFTVGWRNPDESSSEPLSYLKDQNQIASEIFQEMLGLPTSAHDEFCAFVYKYVPDELIQIPPEYTHLKIPPPESPFTIFLREKLIPALESKEASCSSDTENDHFQREESVSELYNHLNQILDFVEEFCRDQNLISSEEETATTPQSLTLMNILKSCEQHFENVTKLIDNKRATLQLIQRCKFLMDHFLQLWTFQGQHSHMTFEFEPRLSMPKFYTYARLHSSLQWLTAVGVSEEEIIQDAIRADILVYLSPFSSSQAVTQISNSTVTSKYDFWSWLAIQVLPSSRAEHNSSLISLIKSFINSGSFNTTTSTKFCSQMASLIYRELLNSDLSSISRIFHHFVSLINFVSHDYSNGTMDESLRVALACLPLQHWSKQEIRKRVFELYNESGPNLLAMLVQASLRDGNSNALCSCSLPLPVTVTGVTFGDLDRHTLRHRPSLRSPVQKELDECLLDLLLKIRDRDSDLGGHAQTQARVSLEKSAAFQFAMKRSLAEHLVVTQQQHLNEHVIAQLITRPESGSASCHLLQRLSFSTGLVTLLLEKCKSVVDGSDNEDFRRTYVCDGCGCNLSNSSTNVFEDQQLRQIGLNCIGFWILANNDVAKCISILKQVDMNIAGAFSAKFYRSAAQMMKRRMTSSAVAVNVCPEHG